MWYIELNGTLLPTPYQYYDECMEEIRRMQERMVAVCIRPVLI